MLRAEFAQPLPVGRLAAVAGMSPSTFHQHFRDVTSLSTRQFQKRLRLIEARRLMHSEGASASSAAYGVGYASVPQFTRDYGRAFGLPPVTYAKMGPRRGGYRSFGRQKCRLTRLRSAAPDEPACALIKPHLA